MSDITDNIIHRFRVSHAWKIRNVHLHRRIDFEHFERITNTQEHFLGHWNFSETNLRALEDYNIIFFDKNSGTISLRSCLCTKFFSCFFRKVVARMFHSIFLFWFDANLCHNTNWTSSRCRIEHRIYSICFSQSTIIQILHSLYGI